MNEIAVTVVPDESCPGCGVTGSPKVCDEKGWWWKCPTPHGGCEVGYWLPSTGETEPKPAPAELRTLQQEAQSRIAGLIPIVRNLPTGGKVMSFSSKADLPQRRMDGYVPLDEDTVQPESYGDIATYFKE